MDLYLRRYWIEEDVTLGNAVIDMYANLGFIDCSHEVIEVIPVKDVVL